MTSPPRKPAAMTLRQRALALLARREYSRTELARRLAQQDGVSAEALEALLDALEVRGWLSDARYAEQRVHARQARYGSRKLALELRERGVDGAVIDAALLGLRDTELARARAVWQRKFPLPAQDARERARQVRFLQARGFGFDVIRRVIDGLDATDDVG